MKIHHNNLSNLANTLRWIAYIAFIYWGLYALVEPVTNIDSQIYNLARLVLSERGSLFNNTLWTDARQVIWPWTFDAIHLPFLHLKFGYALPSFFCLIGTCLIIYRMANERFGPEAAWAAILGLLSLPCVVYQATSTKNDIVLVFSGAVWL